MNKISDTYLLLLLSMLLSLYLLFYVVYIYLSLPLCSGSSKAIPTTEHFDCRPSKFPDLILPEDFSFLFGRFSKTLRQTRDLVKGFQIHHCSLIGDKYFSSYDRRKSGVDCWEVAGNTGPRPIQQGDMTNFFFLFN